ncbi:MAG: transglutaminase domain-containing protein, partial [Planctomycetales bacterium]|nr:transglutaminase domain-containing protein [Planctomycetales bacterium]
DYTVVRFVNSEIDLERMQALLQNDSPSVGYVRSARQYPEVLAAIANDYASKTARGWKQVRAVIEGLRADFQHKRYDVATGQQTGIERFLQERAGPSYLFATVAALILEHLGYETRLVTGFYVNPEHYIASDDEYAVQPSDAHVWLEVSAGHGYWIPLEPTPGYRAPRYAVSWWYRLAQARWQIAVCTLSFFLSAASLYLLRARIFDCFCWGYSPVLSILGDRHHVRWTAWMLDLRMSLLGHKRPRGQVLRKHLAKSLNLPERFHAKLRMVLDASDSLHFGNCSTLSEEQRSTIQELWKELTVAKLRKLRVVESIS